MEPWKKLEAALLEEGSIEILEGPQVCPKIIEMVLDCPNWRGSVKVRGRRVVAWGNLRRGSPKQGEGYLRRVFVAANPREIAIGCPLDWSSIEPGIPSARLKETGSLRIS